MYHSVTFGDKNSWEDWHLVPSSRPVINPPEPKTTMIDVPGVNGALDLSQSLTKYPLFKRRTGDIEFIVVNDFYEPVTVHHEWYDVYSDIMNHLHNDKMAMWLEDESDWRYEGRFRVNSWRSESHLSRITISYDLEPFKWYDKTYEKTFTATTTQQSYTFTKKEDNLGEVPTSPRFLITGAATSSAYITLENPTLNTTTTVTLKPSTSEQDAPRIVFYGDNLTMHYQSSSGSVTVKVLYEKGSL